jgi:hypothetical protein
MWFIAEIFLEPSIILLNIITSGHFSNALFSITLAFYEIIIKILCQ